jgi:ABC-type transport system involved in multi-copper enzyme maturation permease subunit
MSRTSVDTQGPVRVRNAGARLAGFGNQLRRESGTWWSTRRWWTQSLLWTVLLTGLLTVVLWVIPGLEAMAGTPAMTTAEAAAQFAGMASTLTMVGTVVLSQGLLIDERRSGVLEWMLSKPLDRTALLLAKLVGHGVALLVVVVLVPWVVVLALLSVEHGGLWPARRWAGAVALVMLLALFHLSVVLLVAVLTWSRALVIALPLAGIMGADVVTAAVPSAVSWMPWTVSRLTGVVLGDGSLGDPGPVLATTVLTVVALAVASWAFERQEL